MTTKNKVRTFFKKLARVEKDVIFYGFLGNAQGVVRANKNNDVWVVLFNGQVVKAQNKVAPLISRLPVAIGYSKDDPKLLQVLKVWNVYDKAPAPYIPPHGESHTWPKQDFVPVRQEQILAGLMMAAGGMTVQLYGFYYFLEGQFHFINHQVFDLTAYIPGDGAQWVNVEVDAAGDISYNAGDVVDARELLTPELVPPTPIAKKLLFSVKCYYGQVEVIQTDSDTDLFDPRFAGMASGGTATHIEWANIVDAPVVFPPDTSITDPLYSRVYERTFAPGAGDDETEGYKNGDVWIDTAARAFYIAVDVSTGAAVWSGGGGAPAGGGSGDLNFLVDGALAVVDDVYFYLITKDTTIDYWYISCAAPGSAGSTIYDVHLNGTTIFSTSGDRPTLAFDDADGWAKSGVPDVVDFVEGDLITIHIDQVATDAEGLIGVGQVSGSGGGSSFNLIVEQDGGTPTVSNVGHIVIGDGLQLTDAGGGEVLISSKTVQTVHYQTGEVVTGSTTIPLDDTIPQSTEGVELFTLAITPKSADNILKFRVNLFLTGSWDWAIVAVFQDSVADAIAAGAVVIANPNWGVNPHLEFEIPAGATSPTTFKVRAGTLAGTITMNGTGSSRYFGGVMYSSMTITEELP